MRIGFVGGTYTAHSSAVADEECINWFIETKESQGGQVASNSYGGGSAQPLRNLYGTAGLAVFTNLPASSVGGQCWTGSRLFSLSGSQLFEIAADGTQTVRGSVASDANPASIAQSNIQLLVVSGGHAYCYTLATDALLDVTAQLAGVPMQAEYSDGYFIVCFQNSNKFQISGILDGATWPGIQVNAVSVFPENITSIIVNHRELVVAGERHAQPYQNTGSLEIFDPIPGALIEMGSAATFSPQRLDSTIFWIGQDERGARVAWRAQGYSPQRVSTYAVESAWSTYTAANFANTVTYSYQDGGHLFWVVYTPGADCSWVYDVAESLWHKRASWNLITASWAPHWSWNHVYAFGKHLVGDWQSGNIYEISMNFLDDAGATIRRLRRAPTVSNEMEWVFHSALTIDFDAGVGPQPALTDGNGNPRPPQAMLRWSNSRGKKWSNEHIANCGFAGEDTARAIWRRLGRSRYRVYELTVTDPVPWVVVDAYLRVAANG